MHVMSGQARVVAEYGLVHEAGTRSRPGAAVQQNRHVEEARVPTRQCPEARIQIKIIKMIDTPIERDATCLIQRQVVLEHRVHRRQAHTAGHQQYGTFSMSARPHRAVGSVDTQAVAHAQRAENFVREAAVGTEADVQLNHAKIGGRVGDRKRAALTPAAFHPNVLAGSPA